MSLTFDFDQPADRVFALLTDPDFLVERNLALGDLESECEVEEDDREIRVTTRRQKPVELNALLQRFFDPVQRVQIDEVWQRDGKGWRGSYEAAIAGQPVTVAASFGLKPRGKGCRFEITHTCSVKIPVVAGRIKKIVLAQAADESRAELGFARDTLDRAGS